MVFYESLRGSKSSQVSRTLLSILANPNNAVVWIVSTRPFVSKSSNPCTNLLVTVLSTPITIGITVILMLHSFFSVLQQRLGTNLTFHILSILLWGLPEEQRPQFGRFSFSFHLFIFSPFFNITRSACLAKIRWCVCILKSQRGLCIPFSRTDSGLYIYHLFIWSNLNSCSIPCGLTPHPVLSCLLLFLH